MTDLALFKFLFLFLAVVAVSYFGLNQFKKEEKKPLGLMILGGLGAVVIYGSLNYFFGS